MRNFDSNATQNVTVHIWFATQTQYFTYLIEMNKYITECFHRILLFIVDHFDVGMVLMNIHKTPIAEPLKLQMKKKKPTRLQRINERKIKQTKAAWCFGREIRE